MVRRVLFAACLFAGCAAPAKTVQVVEYTPRKPVVQRPPEPTHEERAARADARVAVRGIEGTLSNYDVRYTMEKRGAEFGACHEPRARRMPRLAGNIEFAIKVTPEGAVSQVQVRNSDVGDRALERCFVDVISSTPFPRPNGGEANVTWSMILGPLRPGKDPELWEQQRIERVLAKEAPELRESCAVPTDGSYLITAWVNKRGRVVTAGVSAPNGSEPATLDCLAQGLRSWKMPKPRKNTLAKISFPLGSQEM
ncbi:MAG: AgmX/PglI C-terminal domain-containing protein [Myxococcales bacterium]